MDVTLGLDISHHQPLSLDLAQCRRDGCEFVFLKAGEGGTYSDPTFGPNLAEARAAGLIPAAYWFIRSNASPAAHVAKLRQTVPLDVAIVPDIEKAADGSWPTKAHSDAVLAAILAAGYRVPISYIPLWFWRDYWKSPSLAGWPDLWSSRYPDNIVGSLASEWDQVARLYPHYWNGYGGRNVAVLQFTSSARIGGYQPLDANAYRGTRDQFAALLGGAPISQSTASRDEAQMLTLPPSAEDTSVVLALPGLPCRIVITPGVDKDGKLSEVFTKGIQLSAAYEGADDLGTVMPETVDEDGVGHIQKPVYLSGHPDALMGVLTYSSTAPCSVAVYREG